jgi:hypothetical protein
VLLRRRSALERMAAKMQPIAKPESSWNECDNVLTPCGTAQRRIATDTWFVLAFSIAVVRWGAGVRATGSGTGCGCIAAWK